jgi:hypothetical protein
MPELIVEYRSSFVKRYTKGVRCCNDVYNHGFNYNQQARRRAKAASLLAVNDLEVTRQARIKELGEQVWHYRLHIQVRVEGFAAYHDHDDRSFEESAG